MAELFAAAEKGDAEARRAVDETATLIGIAVANVAAVLDPSLIILGGSAMAQGGPLVAAVRKVVEHLARAPVELVESALGKDAPLCGCLLVAATEARKQVRLRLAEERVGK
jgi:glucokinase